MITIKVIPLMLVLLIGVSGCALYPDKAEQKVRMSKETFSKDYRVAVTAYQREADIDTAVMKTTLWTMMRQSSVNQAVSRISGLGKIDEAMKGVVSRSLPARAEILERSSYGAALPVMGIDIVADDAMELAKDKGYDALLFVDVQPVLTTSDISGMGGFRVQLLGVYQLHKVLPSGEIGGNTVLLSGTETANCPQVKASDKTPQLKSTVDNCVNVLAAQLKDTFAKRVR